MLDLVVHHHHHHPKPATIAKQQHRATMKRDGFEATTRKRGWRKVQATTAVLTLVESTGPKLERGQTEI